MGDDEIMRKGAFMNGISALIKEVPQSSLAPFRHVRIKPAAHFSEGGSPDQAGTVMSEFKPPEL